jgi:hypothetical protein
MGVRLFVAELDDEGSLVGLYMFGRLVDPYGDDVPGSIGGMA